MNELIEKLGINGKLLIAQGINFFVIFIILKRFVFGPLMAIIRKRREEIEQGVALKKQAERDFARIGDERIQVLTDARAHALDIVTAAENEASTQRATILQDAAQKNEAIIQDAKRIIRDEKARITEELTDSSAQLIRLGIAKVLGKMPSKDRDAHLIDEAIRELKAFSSTRVQ